MEEFKRHVQEKRLKLLEKVKEHEALLLKSQHYLYQCLLNYLPLVIIDTVESYTSNNVCEVCHELFPRESICIRHNVKLEFEFQARLEDYQTTPNQPTFKSQNEALNDFWVYFFGLVNPYSSSCNPTTWKKHLKYTIKLERINGLFLVYIEYQDLSILYSLLYSQWFLLK